MSRPVLPVPPFPPPGAAPHAPPLPIECGGFVPKSTMSRLVWPIPLFPLAGALANALLGRLTGRFAHWIAVPALGLSFLASCFVFARVLRGETYVGQLFPWISAGGFNTAVTVQVDQLSAVMLLVVTGVGFLIHL